jgi:hypothetical protein
VSFDPTPWVQQGPIVFALIIAIYYFFRREIRMDRKVDAQQKKCEDREQSLVARLQVYEDRQYELLAASQRIIQKLTDIETDQFKSIKQGDHA